MNLSKIALDRRKLIFLGAFIALSLAFYQIRFSDILGVPSQNFTFFQLIGPIGAGILGPMLGAISVLAVEGVNFIIGGKTPELISIVRLFPMAIAAVYFGSRNKLTAIPAAACMALFWLHPIGAQAWFYALYWIVPLAAVFFKDNIFARSLGTTFTAHAIGSVAFLYAFNLPVEVWAALIPVVAVERLAFASGITLFHYGANTALAALSTRLDLSFLNVERKYALAASKAEQ